MQAYLRTDRVYMGKYLSYTTQITRTFYRLIRDYNNRHGLKALSEECIGAGNKHIKRYREQLASKTSFNRRMPNCTTVVQTESDLFEPEIQQNSPKK